MVASIFVPYIDHKRLAGNKTERWGGYTCMWFWGHAGQPRADEHSQAQGQTGESGASFGLQPDCVATQGKADDRSPWPVHLAASISHL